ncbi:MAG TPA: hypothetical protein PLX69_20985 [Leptospiraceae bacterium]|nr:hypothetical protein [Leptospiraceae bacterium]
MAPLNTSTTNLTLSYDATEILGENDKSLFLHKRPLLNADTMVKKGHFKSALEIYYRAVNKITNLEVQAKIQKNISDIHNYLKSSDPNSEKAFLQKYSDNREKEFSESLKELTENLSDSLTEKLNILKQIETVADRSSGREDLTNKDGDSELKPLDLGSLDARGKKPNIQDDSKTDNTNIPQEEEDSSIKKESDFKTSDIKNQKAEIFNESAQISNETNIQNATIDSDSLQVENQNLTSLVKSESENKKDDFNSSSKEEISELPAKEKKDEALPFKSKQSTETKVVEEIRVIKEYTEKINSLPPEVEQDLSHIETGWSELEKEIPKPKADKDYAPLMKKYEAGNIEIPEATEFITGEFISREAREETKSSRSNKSSNESDFKKENAGDSGDEGLEEKQSGEHPEIPDSSSADNSNIPSVHVEGTSDTSQHPFNVPPLPPPMPLNINDWLSNLFFSQEWEKFKPLPMKERRSGKDRRVNELLELPKGVKKDRRSGKDRRNQDENLLHAREAFLKDWHRDNQSYPHLSQPLKNYPIPSDLEQPISEREYFSDKESIDPNLRSLEFLPRDPSSNERLPNSDELIKVELPEPEEIVLKPQLDQNEVVKESVSDDIANTLSKYIPANEELGLSESDKGLVKIDLPDPVLLKAEASELPHREVSGEIEVSSKDGTGIVGEAANKESAKDTSGMGPMPYSPGVYDIPEELKIELPDPDDFVRTKSGHLIDPFAPEETPEINMIEGDGPLPSDEEESQISEIPELPPPPPEPERTIHGILELKPPEIDDAPFLTLTYDFSKIPHPFKLSKNYSIMEYSYYKYKPMLMKAQEFARRKMLKNALNYYRVIKSQNIPPELKNMINRNITDITEFLEKFIMSKGG